MNAPQIPKAGDRFIMKEDIGNPFVEFRTEVTAVEGDWVQYFFAHIPHSRETKFSLPIKTFIRLYEPQVPTEDAQGKL